MAPHALDRNSYEEVARVRRGARLLKVGLLAATLAPVAPAKAAEPITTRQAAVWNLHDSLELLWSARTVFRFEGVDYAGYATSVTIDDGPGVWGNEAGAYSDAPLWDFQASHGTPGALFAFLKGYEATGDAEQLRRAVALGETLLMVMDELPGGWMQDVAVIDGAVRAVGVWGPWGSRRHDPADLQGWITLDDGTSQSSALALLRLYEATGDVRFLAGARTFGDLLIDLPAVAHDGAHPYANGGIPQVMPLTRALEIGFEQNSDPRNPDGPYMPHKTLNDASMTHALVFLMELYRVTGEAQYQSAIRLNIDYLLDRHDAYGRRGWAQQYHYLTDEPAWGRSKEPPAFVTTESQIVDTLLLWRQREPDAVRRWAIEFAVRDYLQWLRDDAPHTPEGDDHVWRYYEHELAGAALTEPVFADDYVRYVGEENADHAGPGQPYTGRWDFAWVERLIDEAGVFDANRGDAYLTRAAELPFTLIPATWQPTDAQPLAAYVSHDEINGELRTRLTVRPTAGRVWGLAGRLPTLAGAVTDADGDGHSDAIETYFGTAPDDSASNLDHVLGDLDCSGSVELSDIRWFALALTSEAEYRAAQPACDVLRADLNGDGQISVGDIGAMVDRLVQGP